MEKSNVRKFITLYIYIVAQNEITGHKVAIKILNKKKIKM